MRQYNQIKAKHPDTILLFRLGDFFETFGDDAIQTAAACGITLTKRNNGAAGDMPLAGFPHHQLDNYLPKLILAGHRVAVCEQLEDPKQAKGIVKRDVVEVVTPGVVMYDKLLEHRTHTFLLTLTQRVDDHFGVAVIDVSTGTFCAGSVHTNQLASTLESFAPAEILVNKQLRSEWESLTKSLPFKTAITRIESWHFESEFARELLTRHFNTQSLKGFGVDDDSLAVIAAGAALHYVSETQKGALTQVTSLRSLSTSGTMVLDAATRRNLEIHSSMQTGERAGALIGILDSTCTPMGGRLLRWWLQSPLTEATAIAQRHGVVRGLVGDVSLLTSVRGILNNVGDIERLLTKVVTDRANTRDLVALRSGLLCMTPLREVLGTYPSVEFQKYLGDISTHADVVETLSRALVDEPSLQLGTGKIFRPGYNDDVDNVRSALFDGKQWISDYQENERSETGISALKVGTTSVFGYYIEVPRTKSDSVPAHFERKQTLANAERFTTPKLKELEQTLLTAESRMMELERMLLTELRSVIARQCLEIQTTAAAVAAIDALSSFAHVAVEHRYVEPEMHDGTELDIEGARHPVVEQLLAVGTSYIANDVKLDTTEQQIAIITGPNMSGKSSFLRQAGLIVFLAHVGSFIPATRGRIPITDRIFTRVGAQDNITAGESTFLVEMQETANILNNATDRSLVLLDEVGRGTATFDGISIAWAIAEYLHEVTRAKTLFATHYHELTSLADSFERIVNLRVEVREVGDDILFTHKVVPGFTDHSFGIHVAKMAGLPPAVITTSKAILEQLESGGHQPSRSGATPSVERHLMERAGQLTLFTVKDDELRLRVQELDVNNMTPVEALKALAELKETVQNG